MQEASFSGFMKTIIYMIGFYYLIKFLARIFLPIIVKNVVEKAQDNFNKQQGNYTQNNTNQGFNTSKKENPKPTKQIGDYIDYEEVE